MRSLALLLLLTVGCASARTPDVREAQRAWMDALNALDETRIVDAYADDATAFFPVVKNERVDGKEAIAAIFHQYVAGSTKKTNIVPEDLRVQQRGDLAIVTFNVHNPSAVSRRTFVWRWEGGRWRIVHMHASNR
ncbi:MAG TPA: nuclear transport factor 2 family protein [Thermoanaerobaculia bacterium]|nr:nuclear transport factor 2 family protein [Thermoanaerobaculia bacterium]